ncbi:MAG TPA: phosphoribosylglycinamide synthetase C domain-containing protein, partial [Candidatus Bathyarchaeia archaeon]|nr:phosphoribosylglycinamide synthetase C domain-containing protein [Candidatus Bathyarchaeia archaeon]
RNVTLFHAGTARNPAGELVTAGGRVLNVVATGESVETARREAYSVIDNAIQFSGMHYRSDIGAHPTRQRNLQVPRA